MATRRELLLAATGGCLIGRVWASDGAGTVAQVEALAALPGKKPLIRRSFRPPNFETPLADLAAPLTDNGAFFVRYHLTVIPRIDPDSWRLQVSGASARRALTLSLAELRSGFEQVEVVAVNQCAGNRRGLFTPRVPGVQWGGAPARMVVPGWVGTYWMKHLASIRIEPRAFDGFWMKTAYRVPTGAFPGARFTSQETAETTPVTELLVNSLIVSPGSGARLSRGAHAELAGKAWDGGAGIEGVEVSVDGGQKWRDATLQRDLGRFAWREFRFVLDTSRAGRLDVAVRARSRNGAKQPDKLTPNPSGYH